MYRVESPWGVIVCKTFNEMFNVKCNLIILNKQIRNTIK